MQGIFQAIQSGAQVIVPLFAALLLATVPLEWIMMIDVITAVIAVIMLIFFIQIPHEKNRPKSPSIILVILKKGF